MGTSVPIFVLVCSICLNPFMKKFTHINLVCAHKLEAQVLIDKFSLRQIEADNFKLFENDIGMRMIICGMGYKNARAGVEYLGNKFAHESTMRAWLNVGIAGHQTAKIGACLLARKIIYRSTNESNFPAMIVPGISSTELATVDEPELNYPDNVAYDMEAAGFWAGAQHLTSLELIQSLKIISDNPEHSTEAITPQLIQALMEESVDAVILCCEQLQTLVSELNAAQEIHPVYTQLINDIHFTVTQKQQLKKLVRQYTALNRLNELSTERVGKLTATGSAKVIISALGTQL